MLPSNPAAPDPIHRSTSRTLLKYLIGSLQPPIATSNEQPPLNPLLDATPSTKANLLALHSIFPNEFLPALDLLDRGLVTRFSLQSSSLETQDHAEDISYSSTVNKDHSKTYYVRSAQQPRSSRRSKSSTHITSMSTHYEVRLQAWSCSCPAFAFSAFPATAPDSMNGQSDEDNDDHSEWQRRLGAPIDGTGPAWNFGGCSRGAELPVCKHLLACVLVEHAGSLFGHLVEEREVGIEEMAGWGAGWGE